MCIKMMYNITTFIKNIFWYQMVKFNNAKLQLLLYPPNKWKWDANNVSMENSMKNINQIQQFL